MQEVAIQLPRSGVTLCGRRRPGVGMPTLCLHGWLDNCASFDPLLERLPDLDVLAVDLPGHGLSDPLPSVICHYLDYAACVLELAHAQGWDRFQLIGHSLGGAVSTLVAGLHPEKVERLVLIDAIGPLSSTPDEARVSTARYMSAYLGDVGQPVYRTRQQAVKARVQLADILTDTAEQLVERDLHETPGGFTWRTDVRLKYPPARPFGEEQVLAFIRSITAPTLLVLAERTALVERFYGRRIENVPDLRRVTLAGGHHLHMENPDAVAATIGSFLERQSPVEAPAAPALPVVTHEDRFSRPRLEVA